MPSLPKGFDPNTIPDSAWEFAGHSPDGLRRYWRAYIDKEAGTYIQKTENLAEAELLEDNRRAYDESFGQRFGDGKIVARIPLNVFYRDFAPRLKDGDDDFSKWWLNHDDNRPYRRFRGKI